MATKRNVDAYGKSWSPIDIPNLEKAIKLYERLNYLQDHFAGSLSSSNKIMAQINEQNEIQEELKKNGINLTEEECKKVLELFKIRQQENKLAGMGKTLSGTSGIMQRAKSISNDNGQTLSMNNAGNFLAGVAQQRYTQRHMNENLKYFQDIAKQMGRDPNSKLTSKLAENKTVNELSKSAGKFNFAADIIQVAANTFSKAVSTFSGLFFRGLNKQANVYEDTFTNISVRTGTTRSQYFQNQIGTASNLYSSGLAGNIATSEVQEMWNRLAETGMGQEKIFANALETVLTQKIVPYLDASDKYFQQLYNENPNLMKQIRGIGRATNELEGSSEVVTEHLQDLIKDVSPLATLANQELGVQLAKSTGMYQNLRKQGMTDYEIRQYMGSTYQVYTDPLAALKSGNIDQALAVVNMLGDHADMDDYGVNTEYLLRNSNWVSNLIPELSNGQSKLLSGILPSSVDNITRHRANMKNYDIEAAAAAGKAIADNIDLFGEKATDDYINDVNNTLKQIQSNELENLSTWLAAIYEQIGYWGDIVSVLLKGIAGVVGAKVIGGIGKKILSLGGSGGSGGLGLTGIGAGLANGFAKGAPTAIGAGKIGAFTGTAGAVAGAAGVAAGGAMAIKGGMDIYNDLSSGEGWTGKTTASAVGAGMGVAGAGALIALGASNPIGWVALAIGGAALLGRSLYESATNYEKAGKKVEQEFNKVAFELDKEQIKREDNLTKIQENLKQTSDVEKARNDLIGLGVLSAEDEKKWRNMSTEELKKNKDALIKLTDQYIKSTKDFNNTEQELLEQIKKDQVKDVNEAAKSIKDWFEKDYKGSGGDNETNRELAKTLIVDMALELEKKGRSNWSDDEKKFMERYEKNFKQGEIKDSYDDLKWILEGGGSWWGISNAIMSNTSDLLTNSGFASVAQKSGKNIKGFRSLDPNLVPYLAAITTASSKQEAEEAVKKAKEAGMVYNDWKDYFGDSLSKWGIPGFRSGLNYVPYDDYTARLHEGEAVITAATANELRNLIVEYRESQQINTSLDTAIQNQTVTLVNKIDEIIKVMQNDSLFPATAENTKLKNMFNNMRYMRTTKSFNQ